MVNHTMKYTATFAYSSDVMMPGGGVVSNRSRIDSETSGSSESSRGSGKPPRRRSHRPRGCRGGSNRRRHNSSDDKGNKRHTPSRSRSNSNNDVVVVVNNENARKNDNLKINSKEGKQSHQGNQLQNISILSRNFEKDNHQAYPVAITPKKGRAEFTLSGDNYNDMASFHSNHRFDDYATIEPSFSDSSSEGVVVLDGRIFPRPPPHELARNNNDGILPPLPPNAFFNEPIPSGPNPYALKLSNHENLPPQEQIQMQQQQQKFHGNGEPMYDRSSSCMESYNPAEASCGNNRVNFNNNSNHVLYQQPIRIHNKNSIMGLQPTIDTSYDYKAERIEKQRQNVVGGSLFATSPRSFLFGLKKQVHA